MFSICKLRACWYCMAKGIFEVNLGKGWAYRTSLHGPSQVREPVHQP